MILVTTKDHVMNENIKGQKYKDIDKNIDTDKSSKNNNRNLCKNTKVFNKSLRYAYLLNTSLI